MEKAQELGAIGYLVKPVEFDSLKKTLETVSSIQLRPEGGGYKLLQVA